MHAMFLEWVACCADGSVWSRHSWPGNGERVLCIMRFCYHHTCLWTLTVASQALMPVMLRRGQYLGCMLLGD